MKPTLAFALGLALSLAAGPLQARDDRQQYSIEAALAEGRAKGVLDDAIQLHFGPDSAPAFHSRMGEYTANKKTNAFNKSDQEACHWAFLSAVRALQARARKEGGDAVVDIRSYYKKGDFRSASEFECGAGAIMAGVTLVGTVVKL